jgi:hypothetical protein
VATYFLYSVSVRRNSVVCSREPLLKLGVPCVERGFGTLVWNSGEHVSGT